MRKTLPLFLFTLMFAVPGLGQKPALETWGCPETDHKCQLDARMKALQSDPKNPENYYNLGIVFQRMGNHAQAVETFGMYVAIPGLKASLQADGYNNRGISQRALRKPELAIADYSKAIELDPMNAMFLVNRGNAGLDMRRPQDALADYDRAIVVDPKLALAYTNRGRFYVGTGKFDEALKDLTKAIELDGSNPEAFYTRALAYRAKQDYGKAIPDLDKYIALGPGNDRYLADGHLNRGIAYAVTNKPELAEKDISRAIELAPDYALAYGARAVFYRQLKKSDLADADEKKAADLSKPPAPPPSARSGAQSKTSMDYMAEGSKFYSTGDYKRAIPPYQKALDLEKQESKLDRTLWIVLIDNLGMAYGITGDIKSSFAVFEYGISKEPTYPLFYYNMACGYGELGDEDNAIKWLRPAFKNKPNMINGEALPDPMKDSSFAKFRSSEKFTKAVAEMKRGK